MTEVSKETQQNILQLQNTQRQLQMLGMQKQRFEVDVLQMDAALAELEKAEGTTFKNIGGIMIEAKAADLIKELNEKRDNLNVRIDALKRQEEKLRSKAEEMQKKVEKELKPKKGEAA